MPAAKRRRHRRALAPAPCCSPTSSRPWARCPAIPPSAASAKAIWCARSMPWTGLMGRVADAAGIQFRLLNRRKGPAVRGPRAQADRALYRAAMQSMLRNIANLEIRAASAEDLILKDGMSSAFVTADGEEISCGQGGAHHRHIPERPDPYRRDQNSRRPHEDRRWRGSAVASVCPKRFTASVLQMGRLKTGTPPRLDGRTIDWARWRCRQGDEPPSPFSFLTQKITTPQIACGITRTTLATHAVIRANLHRSPMYSGPDRVHRPALLPFHRRQGQPLCRPRVAPDFP